MVKMNKHGFTLAEMTVVILILCIALAVMAPVMTVRNKSQGGTVSSIWKYVEGSSDAYFGVKSSQRAIIGQNTTASDQNAKLIINSTNDLPNQILFRRNGNTVGRFMANENSIAIGDSTVSDNSIVIGYQAKAADGNSVAIGQQAKTEYGSSVVIGDNTTGTGYDVAIGYNANSGPEAIAIGYNAQTKYGGIVIGTEAKATNDAIAIGYSANASAQNSVAIGNGVNATSSNQILLGTSSHTVNVPGTLQMKGSTVQTSDRRLKNVGKEITTGLDKIKELKVFNYTFKDDKNKTPRVGVMAQDLQKVFPNAVKKGNDGYLTIRTEDMFYAMINAIKELDAKVTVLIKQESAKDKKIKELEKRLELLESKIK